MLGGLPDCPVLLEGRGYRAIVGVKRKGDTADDLVVDIVSFVFVEAADYDTAFVAAVGDVLGTASSAEAFLYGSNVAAVSESVVEKV